MDWEVIGAWAAIAITISIALLGANAWLMKLVIRSEINAFHVLMNEKFVTRAECSHCQEK